MTEILFQPLGNPLAASRPLEKIADIDSRLSRTHYFDGRLLTAEDLERDQVYLDERLREAGKVIGEGVAAGLELNFDFYSGILTLSPGSGTGAGRAQLDPDERRCARRRGAAPDVLARGTDARIRAARVGRGCRGLGVRHARRLEACRDGDHGASGRLHVGAVRFLRDGFADR